MSKEDKSWKDALLNTGRPLEVSVLDRVLQIPGLVPKGTFPFDRHDPERGYVRHSVDLIAERWDLGREVKVTLLLESKHRRTATKWIYKRSAASVPGGISMNKAFVATESLVPASFFDRKRLEEHERSYAFGSSPLEVRPPTAKENGKTSINSVCDDGGRQLAYATAAALADAALDTLLDGHLRFVIPISVTTAELEVFRKEPSKEDVHDAASLSELIRPTSLVVSRFPCSDLRDHLLHRLRLRESTEESRGYSRALQKKGIGSLSDLANRLAYEVDGTYVVVNYDDLPVRLDNVIRYCLEGIRTKTDVRSIHAPTSSVEMAAPMRLAGGEL